MPDLGFFNIGNQVACFICLQGNQCLISKVNVVRLIGCYILTVVLVILDGFVGRTSENGVVTEDVLDKIVELFVMVVDETGITVDVNTVVTIDASVALDEDTVELVVDMLCASLSTCVSRVEELRTVEL